MVISKPPGGKGAPGKSGGKGTKSAGSRGSGEPPGAWCGWDPAQAATRKGEEAASVAGGAEVATFREEGAQDSAEVEEVRRVLKDWRDFAFVVAGTVYSMLDPDKALELSKERESLSA